MSNIDTGTDIDNDNNFLWSGESVFCKCGHHVEFHETDMSLFVWNVFHAHCRFKSKDKKADCKCEEFRPYKKIEFWRKVRKAK